MSYKLLSKLYYSDIDEYKKIYKQRFQGEYTYHFNIKINGNEAFCCLCPEIYKLTSEIALLDKKVCEISIALPPVAIKQFTAKSLVDEIILTNDIEGVYSTRKEISLILNDAKNKNKKKRFYGMVTKYKMLREDVPLQNCIDIRNLYNELVLPEVSEDDVDNIPDGMIFRKDLANVTTSTQKVIHKGLYPEEKIIDAMEQALKILNDDSLSCLMRVAVFHYFFGYVHPFYDGNGRTSRFISSYMLSKEYEPVIGYRLSYTIKENISQYYEAFKICNNDKNLGDITPFVIMFFEIVKKSFENLYEALLIRQQNLDKYMEKIEKIKDIDYKIAYVLLQGSLFSRLGVSKKELCDTLEISEPTLRPKLKQMKDYIVLKKNGKYHYYSFDIEKLSGI